MVSPTEPGGGFKPISKPEVRDNSQQMRELEWETQMISLILKIKGKKGKEIDQLKRLEEQIREGKGSPEQLQREVNQLTHELNLPHFEFATHKQSFESLLETVEIYLTAHAATLSPNNPKRVLIQDLADDLLKSRTKQIKHESPKEARQTLRKHIQEVNKKLPEDVASIPLPK